MGPYYFGDVKVSVRSTAEGGHVAYGVEIDGAFMPFYYMPIGGFKDDLETTAQDAGKFYGPPPEGAPTVATDEAASPDGETGA